MTATSVLARTYFFLLLAGLAFGQTTSQIFGTVGDDTGAVIPKAAVEVVGESQGLRKATESNAEGHYVLAQLPADRYRLRIAVAGFKDFIATIELGVGQARQIDAPMRLDTETTLIEVVAGNDMIDTSSARTGSNVTSREVQDIPLNGRTYALLSLTAPGATNAGDGAFDKLRFNGKATEQNKFAYDGIDASAVFDAAPGWLAVSGSQFRLQNSVETIQEFRVDSALYPAEYGTGTGGQIQLVSKSGGNRFHGALFEYFRNDRLDARNFFDASQKSRLRLNQFGANLGGPLLRDRLFFFGSFETLRQRAGMNVLETVPSAAARERGVPEIRPLLRAFPAGFLPTFNPDMDIAQRSGVARLDETNFSGRIDWLMSSAQRVYFRYLKDVGTLDTPDNTVTARNLRATNKPDNFVASLNSSLSTSTVNELKFGINRVPTTLSVDAGVPELFATAINIIGMTVQPGVNGGAPSGVASPGGITRQSSAGNGRGSDYRGKSFTLLDNISHVRGNRQLKTGFEFRAIRVPIRQLGGLTYSFANLDNFLANREAIVTFIGDLDVHVGQQGYYIGYVQEEWRPQPDITLNYGLRYEYYTVNRERDNRVLLFDAGQVKLLDPSTPMFRSDKLAFAPRVGFTWAPGRLRSRTVFRIGGGIYSGPGQYEDQIQPIESNVDRFTLTGQRYPLDLAGLAAGPRPPQSPRAFDVNGYRLPEKNIQYGASIQQQLPGQFVGQVGYVGSLGRNLFQRSITNLITAVDPATGKVARQNPEFGEIDYKTSGGRDTYNALQLSLSRRFSGGLTTSMQYSWSHGYGTSQGSNEALTVQNPFCFDCEKGDGPADIRHYFYAHALYALPLGKGRRHLTSGVASALFDGWTIGGVANGRTGLPINVFLARPDVVNIDRATGRVVSAAGPPPVGAIAVINTPGGGATRATRRPDLVAGVSPYIKDRESRQWLNPAAFSVPTPGAYGNLGRNALRGPEFLQFDLTLGRRFSLREGQSLEFRAEIYNVLNRTNFSNPPATLPSDLPRTQPGQPLSLSTAGFGVITSTVGRTVGLGTSRQIQLGLRYSF